MYNNQTLFIAIWVAVAVFFLALLIAALQYENFNKKLRSRKRNPEDWLLSNFNAKLYRSLFHLKHPDATAVSLGINVEKYYKSCALTRTQPDMLKVVMHHVYGIFFLLVGIVLAVLVSPAMAMAGVLLFVVFVFYEQNKLNHKAEEMRRQIEQDLPRFFDILDTVIDVGLPVDTAIYIISDRFDSLLSREFLESLTAMRMGISGWQQALERVAAKYDVEPLNDFVMEITTAYSKGANINEAIHRKTIDVRKLHLLKVKERAGKAEQSVLLPIVIFQIVPLIAFILLPAMLMILEGF